MSHEIGKYQGKDMMAFTGSRDDIWHRLGNPITDPTDIDQCLVDAGLDWEVIKEPVFLADGRQVPRRVATLRATDRAILGNVSDSYPIRQNREAFSILEDACRDFGVRIETAGGLYGGSRVWMLAKMADDIVVKAKGGEDRIEGYFLTGTSHNGTSAHYGKLTPVRVVCRNTENAALADGQPYLINIPHSYEQDRRLAEARTLVTGMAAALKETGATFNKLAKAKMTKDQIVQFIDTVFPAPDPEKASKALVERRERVLDLVDTGMGAELAGRTAWGAYNAVTEFVDHIKPAEAKKDEASFSAWTSALFGQGDQLKARALNTVRQFVGV